MFKIIMLAIAAMFLYSAGNAAGAEFILTCAWDRGSKFELKIGDNGVIRNGHIVSYQVSINESQVIWHEASPSGLDYEYNVNRQSGLLVANSFSKMYNRKVENRALCVKAGASSEPGF
jgi:hypothetical protein